MKKDFNNAKVNVLIKAFLVFHKGEYVTSKEIANFINSNDFGMNRSEITSQQVSRIIKLGHLGMFKGVSWIKNKKLHFILK